MFGSSEDGHCLVKAMEYDKHGKHKKIADCFLSLTQIKKSTNGEVRVKLGDGELILKDVEIEERFTFLDYVYGDCKIGVTISIDYTMSNG